MIMVRAGNFTESTSTEKDIKFFMSPRARSGWLYSAPSLQTSLLSRSAFQSGAVQTYPNPAPMKNPLIPRRQAVSKSTAQHSHCSQPSFITPIVTTWWLNFQLTDGRIKFRFIHAWLKDKGRYRCGITSNTTINKTYAPFRCCQYAYWYVWRRPLRLSVAM